VLEAHGPVPFAPSMYEVQRWRHPIAVGMSLRRIRDAGGGSGNTSDVADVGD
jgi:hypothetical protein